MKKRIWIALVAAIFAAALIIILLLRGGGSYTVGICYRENESPSNSAYRTALEQALNRQGYELVVTDADNDQAKQLELLSDLANQKCDILIVEPVMAEAIEELKNTVSSIPVPVVLCNRELDMAQWKELPNVFYIGTDPQQAAALQGQMILQLPDSGDINGDGIISYLMISGPENHKRSQIQITAVKEILAVSEKETHLLATAYGDWSVDSGRKLCKLELAEFGKDIEVILCGNDQMAVGAVQAIQDGGRTVGKDVYLLGIDGEPDALEKIAQGSITGTVARDTDTEIESIVKMVQSILDNSVTEKQVIVPYLPITAENTPK